MPLESSKAEYTKHPNAKSEFDDMIRSMRLIKPQSTLPINDFRLKEYGKLGGWIMRGISPFLDITLTLEIGIFFDGVPEDGWNDPNYEHLSKDEIREHLEYFRKMKQASLCLRAQLPLLRGRPDYIPHLAKFLHRKGLDARANDISRIKENCLKYLPDLKRADIPTIRDDLRKEKRGFEHPATGRALVPRSLRDEFDMNPAEFCRAVRAREIEIDAEDFPSFCYPEDGYNSEEPDENLLLSPILAANFRCLFKGPRANLPSGANSGRGRPPLYKICDLREVTPETLAYTACIVRFCYTSRKSWNEDDDHFIGRDFYNNIVDLFSDNAWRDKTLRWWNKEVFGSPSFTPDGKIIRRRRLGPSLIDIIRARCAAASNDTATSTSATAEVPASFVPGSH